MSEANLWTRVRTAVGHLGHFQRLEYNPGDGIPDVNFCIEGCEGHLELKFAERAPARGGKVFQKNHGMREAQEAWFKRRLSRGGRAFILVQVGSHLFLLHGRHATQINLMTVQDFCHAALWQAGPMITSAQWGAFIRWLRSAPFTEWKARGRRK